MLPPPHSLHLLLTRLCSQMPESHVAPCTAYLVHATHPLWTGVALHCEHLTAVVLRTDLEQKPHAYVPS